MDVARHALALVLIGMLAACQAQSHSHEELKQPPSGTPADAPADTVVAQASADIASAVLSKQCGNLHADLHCSAASSNCTQTELTLSSGAGENLGNAKPDEMRPYTAVGLDCVVASDGAHYLVVLYGERPYGCASCEWYYLHDAAGRQLTHSNPLFLHDNSLQGSQQQHPNNREFDAALDKLGIQELNTELLGRP